MTSAYERIAAQEKQLVELRAQVATLQTALNEHTTLLALIVQGGLVELSSVDALERDPATLHIRKMQTARRVVVDESRVLIEREQLQRLQSTQDKCAVALIEAVRFAKNAFDEAYRSGALAADLIEAVRAVGSAHGIGVTVTDGRATVTRDPSATKTLLDAKCTFHQLATRAVERVERELAAGVQRLLISEGQMMRASVQRAIDTYAARRLGDSPSA